MGRAFCSIMLLLLLISSTMAGSSIRRVWARTIVVPDDYPAIQTAINNAIEGDTIYVRAGTYSEDVVVNKTLSLTGENKSTTVISGYRIAVHVTASNVAIKGFTIRGAGAQGICFDNCNGNIATDNLITSNSWGMILWHSNGNTIVSNTATSNGLGMWLHFSSGNTLRNNTMTNNQGNFGVIGGYLQDIDTSNKVNGNPIYYMVNKNNLVIDPSTLPNVGFLGVVNSINTTIRNMVFASNIEGMVWASVTNSLIENVSLVNNVFEGALLDGCSHCIVRGNTATSNDFGILLKYSDHNDVYANRVANSYTSGIEVDYWGYNDIHNNTVTSDRNSDQCIMLMYTGGNNITGNNLIGSERYFERGIELFSSDANIISENNITNFGDFNYSPSGIGLSAARNNLICHNNFVNNKPQTYIGGGSSGNLWNSSYPSGGNYWSDYNGTDLHSGPYQNETGSDGIGDSPYVIDASNRDNYPLVEPYCGSVRNLDTGQSYPTIQAAINNATEGNRILALSGTYYENIVLNKTVTLVGENKGTTIIDGGSKGDVVMLTASNVCVTGFTMQNSGKDYRHGVYISEGSIGNNLSYNIMANNQFGLLSRSSRNTICGNNIAYNEIGLCIDSSSHNIICDNNITNNERKGVVFWDSSNDTLSRNVINNNTNNFDFYGGELGHYMHLIDSSNVVDGKPVYYLVNQTNLVISHVTHPEVGYLGLVNCVNITVEGLTLTNNGEGLLLVCTNNSKITSCNITDNDEGVYLFASSGNIIAKNNITTSNKSSTSGINLVNSHNNTVEENTVTNMWAIGIKLQSSENNKIAKNYLDHNDLTGIFVNVSPNNTISENYVANAAGFVANDGEGILLQYSPHNLLVGNTLANNSGYGIWLIQSDKNIFYHNSFVSNWREAGEVGSSENVWDGGYPTGGNYWSDYAGLDLYRGAYQNESGSDGVGDVPYIIDASNADHYPLMTPWPTHLSITVISPQNNTYYSSSVPICFTLTKPASWAGYSLDNQQNMTISSNTILAVSDGLHQIVMYANDSLGTMVSSEIVHFTVASSLHDPYQTSFIGLANYPIGDLAEGNGNLYATSNNLIYVYDGESWNVIQAPTHTISLMSHEGKLLVAGKGGLYVFNGTTFTQVINGPAYYKMLGTYNDTIYAATYLDQPPKLYYCNGSAENSADWHVDTGFSTILNFSGAFGSIDSFAVYNGKMYVASGNTVYCFDGTSWSVALSYEYAYAFLDMQVYDGKLYLATRDLNRIPLYMGGTGFSGTLIEYDGENWTTILGHDYWVYSLEVYDGKLYVGTANRIYTYNGTAWDVSFYAENGAFYAVSMITYDGKIYAGMGNGYIFADPAPAKAEHETITVPEFSSTTVLAVFMALTMLAVALTGKKRSRRFN